MAAQQQPIKPCHVVAMPYPGRGHINPMMNLCNLLLSKKPDILITFVVTEEWLALISAAATEPPPRNLRFATMPNVIPSEHDRAKDFAGFVAAVAGDLPGPFEQLLDRLQPPPTAIVADTFLKWAVGAGRRRKIPVASFWTQSALTFSVIHHFDLLRRHGHFPADLSERGHELVDYIPGVSKIRLSDLPTSNVRANVPDLIEGFNNFLEAHSLVLSSFYELEPSVTDALKSAMSLPIYTVGPTIPYTTASDQTLTGSYFSWLDSQPPNSVLYVSLGSFLSVSETQLNEIIAGIVDSGVRFLWVARGDTERIRDACGHYGKIVGAGDTCMVVSWCDQMKVLCHGSVGGFWTHCGWNSTLEGIFTGLPMLTCPILWDQVPNSKEVSEDWGIGIRVSKGLVRREEVAGLVRRLMDGNSEEGREMRRKSSVLKECCRRAVAKGGSSDVNLDAFISRITKE